jgi:hypothetical protein
MQKPQGYDEVQVGGDFTPVELGGHHLIIKAVKEQESKTGKPMIVVAFDFAKNDKQPGYFSDLFDKDIRPEKKWPNNGTMYIMTMDYKDSCKTSKTFKSFITAFERSNNVNAIWGEDFCKQFAGKKIGGVFGMVEEEYNGEVKKRHKLRWFCDDKTADSASVPEAKLLKSSSTAAPSDGFMNIPVGTDEEIPF